MRELAKKVPAFAYFCAIYAIFLCACIEPVDKTTFFADDKVFLFIESGRERVKLINYTPDNLIAENGRIRGLNQNRYYMVEIRDGDGLPYPTPLIKFVGANGQLGDTLAQIGRVGGGAITGLSNQLTYVIWSASPVNDVITVTPPCPNNPPPINDINGLLTLSDPVGTTYNLDIGFDVNNTTRQAVKVPVTPSGAVDSLPIGTMFDLEVAGTTTDYVFYDEDDRPVGNQPAGFTFLRVVINKITELTINLTPYALPQDLTPDPSTNAVSIAMSEFEFGANTSNTRTFTINNAAGLSNFIWTYNGVPLNTATHGVTFNAARSQIIINFGHAGMTNAQLNSVGTRLMTVQANGPGNVPWSGFITIIIVND
jgi:hypothetical protein